MANHVTSSMGILEQIRFLRITFQPYLPPPVLSAIRTIDRYFENVTPEASTVLFLTMVLGYVMIQFIRAISSVVAGTGNMARFKDENDVFGNTSNVVDNKSKRIVGTVVLCGPSNAGKTVLFHALCCDPILKSMTEKDAKKLLSEIPMATVTSIQASDGFVPLNKGKDKDQDKGKEGWIRLLDYPGHVSLRSSLPLALETATRIVLVLDASKAVTEAADILFMLLTHSNLPWNQNRNKSSSNSSHYPKMKVLVACHKSDLALAKNVKRIKIQLRTELDRLRKIHMSGHPNGTHNDPSSTTTSTSSSTTTSQVPHVLGIPGKALDLDNKDGKLSCDLTFVAVSCQNGTTFNNGDGREGWQEVQHFIQSVSE